MKLPKRAFYKKNHVSLSESNADKHQESEMGSDNDGSHYTLMMYDLSVSFYF